MTLPRSGTKLRKLFEFLDQNTDFTLIPPELRGTKRDLYQRLEELRNFYYCDIEIKRQYRKPALYKLSRSHEPRF